jgi:multicomponent Na+:H+ antiporter subunit E
VTTSRTAYRAARARRGLTSWLAVSAWAYAVWLLLTWTLTAEQLLFGLGIAVLTGIALAPLVPAAVAPWQLLEPRRLAALLRLLVTCAWSVLRANVALSVRIWRPSRPLRSGMVVVPTECTGDGGLAAVGIITSLVVDNQVVEVDQRRRLMRYHCIEVPDGTPVERREHINGPVERRLRPLLRPAPDPVEGRP